MKVLRLIMSVALVSIIFTQCKKDNLVDDYSDSPLKKGNMNTPAGTYTVTVENVSTPYDYFAAGAALIPDGKESQGPAFQGESFTVKFHAGKGHKLSFATMYGASNDLFFAPGDEGIALFNGTTPITMGTTIDITDMIHLWDAGTEVNHSANPPGTPEDVNQPIKNINEVENPNDYGSVSENIQVLLTYDGTSMFTLTIKAVGSLTPLSPVAWVVYSDNPDMKKHPIFKENVPDYGNGLEALAETGNAGPLSEHLKMNSGYVSPVAPVLWVLHDKKDKPVFTEGMPDYGMGLETLAETGDPGVLNTSLTGAGYETGVQALPEGKTMGEEGPIFPGQKYVFTIEGHVGQSLSITSMLGASNDEFFSTGDEGIKLSNGVAEMDITHFFEIYDAGTEVNEYPGAGIHQGGPVENSVSEMRNIMPVNDEFMWPEASQVIKVTIKKN